MTFLLFNYHKRQRIGTFSKEASPFNTHNSFLFVLEKEDICAIIKSI